MARPIDIHVPGGVILLTQPGTLPARTVQTRAPVDLTALVRLRGDARALDALRRDFPRLGLPQHDIRFAHALALLDAVEKAVRRRALDLHWLPTDTGGEVTQHRRPREDLPASVRDWSGEERIAEALRRAARSPAMRREFDMLMRRLLDAQTLPRLLPLILRLARDPGGAELTARGYRIEDVHGIHAMLEFGRSSAALLLATDQRQVNAAADEYAIALMTLGTHFLARLVDRLGRRGHVGRSAADAAPKAKAKPAGSARFSDAPPPRPAPAPKPAAAATAAPTAQPAAKAAPAAQPAAAPACKIVKHAMTCEHGRAAGPAGILMVVPNSSAALGDKISNVLTMEGQCGQHPAWSVGGHWTSSGKGTKFDFNAAKWAPSINGLISVKSIDPHVYKVSASACAGSVKPYEVRAYPPGGQSAKLDARKIVDQINHALRKLPIPAEKLVVRHQGAITWSAGWKEDEKSWKAYCEFAINGAMDPLLGVKAKGQFYPPNLIPQSLSKWVKAGLFVELAAGFKISVGVTGRYWPDANRTQWNEKNIKGGGGGTVALSLELALVSSEVVEAALVGESGLEFEASGVFGEDPKVAMELKWPGLKAKATIKAAWGYVEYSREWQLIGESKLLAHEWPLAQG